MIDKKKKKTLTTTYDSPDKNSSPNKSPRRSPRLAEAAAAKVPGRFDVDLTEELHPHKSKKLLALPESTGVMAAVTVLGGVDTVCSSWILLMTTRSSVGIRSSSD